LSHVEALSSVEIVSLMRRFQKARLWVAGDLMLDEYLEGEVGRISPEAPVQVVKVARTFHRLGGAANVAHCLATLGAQVSLCGVVGDDAAGALLLSACLAAGIDVRGVRTVAGRPTTRKQRVLSQRQQLLRMDWESTEPIDAAVGAEGLAALCEGPAPDAIVISDYAKGFLSAGTLRGLIDEGRARGVPVLVDPKRSDYAAYRGATYITPNLKELREALGGTSVASELPELAAVARPLIASAELQGIVVTLGDRGLLAVPREGEPQLFQSVSREVYDVTGAGDAVIAVLALGLAAGAPLSTAARLANVAAGIVVGKVGTAVVEPDELVQALSPRAYDKVHTRASLAEQVAWWRLQGRRIVFTNGCFDLLHVGHLSLLRQAATHGDVLVVGINSDASVVRLKGPKRPLIPEHERAALLAGLDCVGAVVAFDEDTPLELLQEVRPHVLVKGADYRVDQVVGRELVESLGGKVVLVPLVAEHSTSALVERIRAG
jgi:D-beta-D-heptose 7-phosphate kinase/D-beta-D-heptose 1-phosphate adenosyltransferase